MKFALKIGSSFFFSEMKMKIKGVIEDFKRKQKKRKKKFN